MGVCTSVWPAVAGSVGIAVRALFATVNSAGKGATTAGVTDVPRRLLTGAAYAKQA